MKTVLVGGCFDVLHLGHIRFLNNAKRLGDTLIVALESDENVKKMKGSRRPIHTQAQRCEMLLSLKCVDKVISLDTMTSDADYQKLVERIHPSIIAVTDGDLMLTKKKAHAKRIGASVIVIQKIHTPSTSQLAKLLELE